jgi:hypothetical protein
MRNIKIDASDRQLSKLRNGHKVRIKKGTGFNLVVNPSNFNLVNKAFNKNKGLDIKLSSDELDANILSPEEQMALTGDKGVMSGSGIFKKRMSKYESESDSESDEEEMTGGRAGPLKKTSRFLRSKEGKSFTRAARPIVKKYGQKGMQMLDNYIDSVDSGDSGNMQGGRVNLLKGARKIAKNPVVRQVGKQALKYGVPVLKQVMDSYVPGSSLILDAAAPNLGKGLYAGRGLGAGMNDMDDYNIMNTMSGMQALKLAGLANANANRVLADMNARSVYGRMAVPVIPRSYDDWDAPRSRYSGGGMQMQGRGTLLDSSYGLIPAMVSQPYSANYFMQNMLPPEYQKYNDGGATIGRGLGAGMYI